MPHGLKVCSHSKKMRMSVLENNNSNDPIVKSLDTCYAQIIAEKVFRIYSLNVAPIK